MRARSVVALVAVAAVSLVALGASPRLRDGWRHRRLGRDRIVKIDEKADAANILAIHDRSSSDYDGNCLECHAGVLEEGSQDPRILSFHQAMIPYMPGYNPAHGPSNETCTQCHDQVDLLLDSSGGLRVRVNPELCALCHGPAGPGPVYYQR